MYSIVSYKEGMKRTSVCPLSGQAVADTVLLAMPCWLAVVSSGAIFWGQGASMHVGRCHGHHGFSFAAPECSKFG